MATAGSSELHRTSSETGTSSETNPSSPPHSESAKRTAEARAAFIASLNSVGSHVESDLTSRAKDIHNNSAAIARQEKDVVKETAALAKEAAQYQKIADDSRGKLKEIGDVQNWAEMLERDLLVVEETLRIAEEEEREEASR